MATKKDETTNITDFTGITVGGDEIMEWHDDETEQYAVVIQREWRHLEDLNFYFRSREEAHAAFMALCQVTKIVEE